MQLKSGLPYSLVRYGLLYDYPRLDKDVRSDVCIIGAGISGALACYQLARKHISSVVVDERSVGLGSTCASTSLLQYELDVPLFELKEMIGRKAAEKSYSLCCEAIDGLKEIAGTIGFNGFEKKHSLYYTASSKDMAFIKNEFNARKNAGLTVRLLTSEEIRKLAGFNAEAAILSDKAAQMDSYRFTHALHQYNLGKGVNVYDRTSVKSVSYNGKVITLYTENGYKIHCRYLIHASGYETVEEIKIPKVQLNTTYVVASEGANEPIAGWNDRLLLWNTAMPYLYMRSTPDHRILVGGRDAIDRHGLQTEKELNRKKNQLSADFRKLFPGIPFKPEFSWSGVFASTRDGLPYIGTQHGHPNSFVALGFGGNGITFSLIASEIIAEKIAGRKPVHEKLFGFNR